MNRNFFKHAFFTLLALTPALYLQLNWGRMPEQIATHFAADGTANGFTERSSLWGLVLFLCGIAIASYYLMQFINKVDPRRRGNPVSPMFNKMAITIVLFLTSINLLTLISAVYPEANIMGKAIVPIVGLLLAVIGNYMYNVRQNYYVGIKVPWALASEYNWRKTHHLGGRLWVIGGILIIITSLLLPREIASVTFNVLIGIMVLVPIAYSFILFRKEGNMPHYYDKMN
ncbi:SdpI family protein [Polluticoccus soli]|uniref:SdpI family protein n=1 Tax=Polluticoccus soli TaxID=3034150 RepID=UPI0023E2DB11|nr:SdpI family protein [Flavipsychrobacter sp. JY13-12]